MNPDDVESYINSLQKKGFIYLSKTDEDDLVVADQLQGLYVNCNWLRFGRVNHDQDSEESVAACIHVDDKAKYTDWSRRDDIKAELKVDLIILLAESGYPPVDRDEMYNEIFEQAENLKKNRVE